MAAMYAKGSYAMAHAGDVTGALHGMSFTSLIDLSDLNNQSVLGEYLEDIKKMYFSREMDSRMQNLYDVHLTRNFDKQLQGNSFYQPQGQAFIKSANLNILLPGTEPRQSNPAKPGYGIYPKYWMIRI